jgi:16S rRNA (guanine966-N2)-methyltransferase
MRIIAGTFRNRVLHMPKGSVTRPTASRTRGSVFNIIQASVQDSRFLDICAGSGAMGIEAISRGAHHATFIDHSKEAIATIKKNIDMLDIHDKTSVIFSDAYLGLKKLERQGNTFDFAFFDPPYTKKESPSSFILDVITLLDTSPSLLVNGATVFVEDRAECPIDGVTFTTLFLKSTRKMGDTILREYIRTTT